ncbi:MAG: hypothetical protein JJ902_16405 [Roseibium sp.]|nr:hypothetical protein [Roseibium sp.]
MSTAEGCTLKRTFSKGLVHSWPITFATLNIALMPPHLLEKNGRTEGDRSSFHVAAFPPLPPMVDADSSMIVDIADACEQKANVYKAARRTTADV